MLFDSIAARRLCPECGASFPSPLKLSVHMATVHDSSQTSVVCDQCGKWFPHPNKLMRHKYSHHNNKKLLECHACDKVREIILPWRLNRNCELVLSTKKLLT